MSTNGENVIPLFPEPPCPLKREMNLIYAYTEELKAKDEPIPYDTIERYYALQQAVAQDLGY